MKKYSLMFALSIIVTTAYSMDSDFESCEQEDKSCVNNINNTPLQGNVEDLIVIPPENLPLDVKHAKNRMIKSYKINKWAIAGMGVLGVLTLPAYGIGCVGIMGAACMSSDYKIYKLFKAAEIMTTFDPFSALNKKRDANVYSDAVKRINEAHSWLKKAAKRYPKRNVLVVEPKELVSQLNAYATMPLLTQRRFVHWTGVLQYLFFDGGKLFHNDRQELAICNRLLDGAVDLQGMNRLQIQKLVVNKYYPEINLEDKSNHFIHTLFVSIYQRQN